MTLLLLACTGDKITLGDTGSTGETDAPSALAGEWSGDANTYVSFYAGWEEAAYCIGSVEVTVDEAGDASGSGECTLDFGPYAGLVGDIEVSGSVEPDIALVVEVTFNDLESTYEHDALTGEVDGDALSASVEGVYHSSTGDDYDTIVEVALSR